MKENRMKKNAIYAQTVAVVGALLLLTPLTALTGCGGGSKGGSGGVTNSRATGSLRFTIKWPEKTRLIPVAANSIVLRFDRTVPGPTVGPTPQYTLVAPADNITGAARQVSQFVDNLELGTYRVTATAYPNADGTGVAQATTSAPKDIAKGPNADLILIMDATVKTLEVTPATGPDTTVGKTRQLIATPKDADGNIVIVGTANVKAIKWESLNPDLASVDQNGVVTTLGVGEATIRATYQERDVTPPGQGTGATAQATVNIVDAGPLDGFWSKFHGDSRNTGQATTGAPTGGNLLWKFAVDEKIVFSSPVVGKQGTIYVGSYDHYIYAINPDGSLKWKFQTGDVIDSTPVIDRNETVYVGSADGKIYALRGATGEKIWEFKTDGEVNWSPALSKKGVLYVGSSGTAGKTLYALDSLNGAILWQFTAGDAIQTAPAFNLNESRLYFGGRDGNLYALDVTRAADADKLVWKFTAGGEINNSSPAVDKAGNIYFGSLDKKVYALTPDGTLKSGAWPFDAGAAIFASPAIKGNDAEIYVATFDLDGGNHRLIALDPTTGTQIWDFPVSGGITSSPAIGVDGVIYFGSYDSNLYGINSDGSLKWKFSTTEAGATDSNYIDSSPGIGANGTVYVGTFGKSVLAFQ